MSMAEPAYFASRAAAEAAAPTDRPHIVVNVAARPRRAIPPVEKLFARARMEVQ